jgi:hypothetical protein
MNGLGLADVPRCVGSYSGLPSTTLAFRDAHGAEIAQGVYPQVWPGGLSSSCKPFTLAVNGQQPAALDGAAVLLRLQKRLNADFSAPLPVVVSYCLRKRGWQVRPATRALTVRKNGRQATLRFLQTGKVTTTGTRTRAISRCLRSRSVIYLG